MEKSIAPAALQDIEHIGQFSRLTIVYFPAVGLPNKFGQEDRDIVYIVEPGAFFPAMFFHL